MSHATVNGSESGPVEAPLFSARIHPHRSLRIGGFRLVMALVGVAGIIASIPFIVLGFWPVAGFYGLDIALLYFAFRANFAAARSFEEIVVHPFELHLVKVHHSGLTREWRFNPVWTRLHRDIHDEFGVQRLSLVSRGESVTVGHFLTADEKESFGKALASALTDARRGPTYSHV
jgi:uncharacterized membrane protein